MADQKEPKKETVRITLPPRAAGQPPASTAGGRDTVRINLPARPPSPSLPLRPPTAGSAPVARPPQSQAPLPPAPSRQVSAPPTFRTPPAPPASGSTPPPNIPSSASSTASSAGPKKETARIAVLPDPPPKSPVQMKKTQPLITMPEAAPRPASVPVVVANTSDETVVADSIPMSLSWGLLAASAVTLIIQIWNYFG